MAPTKLSAITKALRRSERIAKPTAPAADDNRVTKPQAPHESPRYTCSICDRELAASAFYKTRSMKNCTREVYTCKACLKEWITMSLESTYDKLSCPQCP